MAAKKCEQLQFVQMQSQKKKMFLATCRVVQLPKIAHLLKDTLVVFRNKSKFTRNRRTAKLDGSRVPSGRLFVPVA